jgi:hypothetical protein
MPDFSIVCPMQQKKYLPIPVDSIVQSSITSSLTPTYNAVFKTEETHFYQLHGLTTRY